MTVLFPSAMPGFRRCASVWLRHHGRRLASTFSALLLAVVGLLPSPAGHAADWQTVTAGKNTATLNGAGVARQLNEDMYIALLYVSRTSSQPTELLDSRQRRLLQLRVLADRLYPSGVARHFRDLVAINNPRDEIAREAKNLNQFYSLFQHGLMRGDELVLDNLTDNGLRVRINGSTVATINSPLMFDLLLRAYLGERPLSAQLRSALLGETDAASRNATLDRFAALQPSDERISVYNKPVASAPTPVVAEASTAAPISTEPTKPTAATSSKPASASTAASVAASKPASANTKPAAPAPRPSIPPSTPAQTSAQTATPAGTHAPSQSATTASTTVAASATETAVNNEPSAPALSDAEIASLLADYEQRLREQLQSALEYPTREMRRKHGNTQLARRKETLQLRLHLDLGGDINAAWLQTRSGEPILDAAALKLVETQAPFAPLPKALPDSAYEFLVSLQFDPDQ